jgi:hypothetical protein
MHDGVDERNSQASDGLVIARVHRLQKNPDHR